MNNLVYGFHSISPLVWQNPDAIEIIYLDGKRQDKRSQDLLSAAKDAGVVVEMVSSSKLDKISATNKHQGVVALLIEQVSKKDLNIKSVLNDLQDKDTSIIIVLDGITDPHNLGAIIRSCDCFGVDAIVLPKDNSASINPTVAKVSSGAINNVPIVVVNNLARTLEEIKDFGYWIAGTTLADSSVNLFDFKPDNKIVWVMGSEGDGIRRLVAESCDHLVSIPMYGKTQSLNVSVAAGVVLSYTRYSTQK